MPKVQTARGGKVPYEFCAAAEELFGEALEDVTSFAERFTARKFLSATGV